MSIPVIYASPPSTAFYVMGVREISAVPTTSEMISDKISNTHHNHVADWMVEDDDEEEEEEEIEKEKEERIKRELENDIGVNFIQIRIYYVIIIIIIIIILLLRVSIDDFIHTFDHSRIPNIFTFVPAFNHISD